MARASRGAWVRFNVVRTDRRGRFRTRYRFQQPGAAVFRFRALSLSEAAYPVPRGRLEHREGAQGLREPETGLEPVTTALQERCSTS